MTSLTFPDDPEPNAVVDTPVTYLVQQPRGRLEELVDRLMAALTFRVEPENDDGRSVIGRDPGPSTTSRRHAAGGQISTVRWAYSGQCGNEDCDDKGSCAMGLTPSGCSLARSGGSADHGCTLLYSQETWDGPLPWCPKGKVERWRLSACPGDVAGDPVNWSPGRSLRGLRPLVSREARHGMAATHVNRGHTHAESSPFLGRRGRDSGRAC